METNSSKTSPCTPDINITASYKDFPSCIRLLVMDDDHVSLKSMASMLLGCGYEVLTATTAEEGLNILRMKKIWFDGVIAGFQGVTALDVIKEVKLDLKIPVAVIIISADSHRNVVIRGYEYGACFYIVKPVTKEHLQPIWHHVWGNAYMRRREHEEAQIKRHYAVLKGVQDPMSDQAPQLTRKQIVDHLMSNQAPQLTSEQIANHLQKYHVFQSQNQDGSRSTGKRKYYNNISPVDTLPFYTEVALSSNSHVVYGQDELLQRKRKLQNLQLQQQRELHTLQLQRQLQHLQLEQQLQQQPWIPNSSSLDLQTLAPNYQLPQNIPGGLVNVDTMLPRSGMLNNNPMISNFNGFNFQAQNNIADMMSIGPLPTFNQAQVFTPSNNSSACNQNLNNNNTFNQPTPVAGSSSFIQAAGSSNLFGNMTCATQGVRPHNTFVDTNIASQGAGTSNMVAGANLMQEMLNHEQQAKVVNHAMDDQFGEAELDQLIIGMVNMDSFGEFFSAVELDDTLPDQGEQGGEDMMEHFNFDYSDINLNI